jgi:hypothetical protein
MKTYHIWIEAYHGHVAQGDYSPEEYLGSLRAETFEEACDMWAATLPAKDEKKFRPYTREHYKRENGQPMYGWLSLFEKAPPVDKPVKAAPPPVDLGKYLLDKYDRDRGDLIWQIEFLRSGTKGTYTKGPEGQRDTTEESLAKCRRQLVELDEALALLQKRRDEL